MSSNNQKEIKLWPVQERILSDLKNSMRTHRRIVLMAMTGLGKTEIAIQIISNAIKKNKRVCFVCHRLTLVNQTSERLEHYGILHGVIQGDNPAYFPDRQVQVCSIQTLIRRKQEPFDLYIFDECHVQFSGHRKIMDSNQDAFFIGLSASPYTKSLGKYYSGLCHPVLMKELISEGVLKTYEVYGPDTISPKGVRTVAGEYHQGDAADAADKPKLVADVVETWLKLGRDRKTMVFSSGVPHGRHLEKEFLRHGISAVAVDGYMKKESTDEVDGANKIIEDFRTGKYQVIISADMLIAGFDVREVSCVSLATLIKSPIKFCQGCGRGLRKFDGVPDCLILDHGGNFNRLGWLEDIEADFVELDDGKKSESKNKKKEKVERLPKACPSCDFMKPAGVHKCPACGFIPQHIEPVETEQGELKKLQRTAKKDYTMVEKQAFLAQLNQYASDKGYKAGKRGVFGWAIKQFKSKFGVNPSNAIRWNNRATPGPEVLNWIKHQNIIKAKAKNPNAVTCKHCGCAQTRKRFNGTIECGACGEVIPSNESTKRIE